jgi:flagellar basal body rod protein FlgG
LTPGEIVATHNPLHVAIDGDGFFSLTSGDQTACTRCGRFDLNERRELIQRHDGREWMLQPPLQIPVDAVRIEIAEDGTVTAFSVDGAEGQSCGRIQLVDCINPQQLRPIDGSLLQPTPEAGTLHVLPPERTHLLQHHLEQSNATLDGEQRVLDWLDRRGELLNRLETPGAAHQPASN